MAKKPREKSTQFHEKRNFFGGDILYANLIHVISRVFSPELLLLLITHHDLFRQQFVYIFVCTIFLQVI